VQREAQTPLLYFAYKSVPANDPMVPAIELLMIALTEGNASRLHRLLVEERKLAIEIASDYVTGFDPGLTWLRLTLPQGADVAAVEKELDAALEKVVREGISAAELRRAKNLNATDFWKQLETIDGKAFLLGRTEVYAGDYRKLFELPAAYEKVTREEVQSAAKLILQKNHRTVGVLEPAP
jgi:zinc protease